MRFRTHASLNHLLMQVSDHFDFRGGAEIDGPDIDGPSRQNLVLRWQLNYAPMTDDMFKLAIINKFNTAAATILYFVFLI